RIGALGLYRLLSGPEGVRLAFPRKDAAIEVGEQLAAHVGRRLPQRQDHASGASEQESTLQRDDAGAAAEFQDARAARGKHDQFRRGQVEADDVLRREQPTARATWQGRTVSGGVGAGQSYPCALEQLVTSRQGGRVRGSPCEKETRRRQV